MANTNIFIENISFNDGQNFSFSPSDIVVFTGPNNSGKSQVLRDLMNFYSKPNATRILAKDVNTIYEGDIQTLVGECINRNGRDYLGNIDVYKKEHIKDWWDSKDLRSIHSIFINHLTTENRLNASKPAPSFDVVNEAASTPLQILYIEDGIEKNLSDLFHSAFGKELIVNRGGGSLIPLHVGHQPKKEVGEDRVSESFLKKLNLIPQIQNQGDGMRSFASILLDTFTSKHSITLIDEPEAFLHPPQARLLGKILGQNTPNSRQLFISTHSEDFLKGLLEADNDNIKIFRIDREENINHMNFLANNDIRTLWQDPILRYSNILSGLFHSKTVICESDTDCRFYQTILNSIQKKDSISPDILFTHCGGKQRLKVVIRALKSLNVHAVVIGDIDILNSKEIFQEIIESLGMKWIDVEKQWRTIDDYVKSQRAQLNTEEVKKELKLIFDTFNEEHLTKEIAEKIKKVIKMSSAWSKVKETGKSFFNGNSYTAYNELSDICKKRGLLIVPVGELEGFYKPNSNHGVKWVNEVIENVDLIHDPELEEARSFVRQFQ